MALPIASSRAPGRAMAQESSGKWSESQENMTPTTTFESDSDASDFSVGVVEERAEGDSPQLGPGLYHGDIKEEDITPAQHRCPEPPRHTVAYERSEPSHTSGSTAPAEFSKAMTLFVFDWDDTLLPSSWIRSQGFRLDDGSRVPALERRQLAEVAPVVIESLRLAKLHGTVVLVTSAERGWIELSCRKFLPTVLPMLEGCRMVSARTSYEGPRAPTPLDWKMRAFQVELSRFYGAGGLMDSSMRKNIFSLGDGAHEREALLQNAAGARNCRAKSLKFVEHPDLGQIIKQHQLIIGSFKEILHHDGDLDMSIHCP